MSNQYSSLFFPMSFIFTCVFLFVLFMQTQKWGIISHFQLSNDYSGFFHTVFFNTFLKNLVIFYFSEKAYVFLYE